MCATGAALHAICIHSKTADLGRDLRAFSTKPSDFNRRLFRLEASPTGDRFQTVIDLVVVEFRHVTALVADHKGDGAMAAATVMRMGAGDEGVQAFEAMNHAELDQLVERAVDLQGGAKAVFAQLVEQRVS